MTPNMHAFFLVLNEQYARLFATDPAYAYAATNMTPEALARKMTEGLSLGRASKDGAGIKATCKALGIKYTYDSIRKFLID